MIAGLGWLDPVCGSGFAPQAGLLGGLFVAGAAGSVMHCGPMCGVFVLSQVSDRMSRLPAQRLCEWQRLRIGLLLPYHLGRLTTYTALGAVAGGSGGLLQGVSPALLAAAALLFLAHAAGLALPEAPLGWGRLLRRATACLPREAGAGSFLTGVALGFLPCGLLYAALISAAAAGGAAYGGTAMLAFGLGTVPMLAVIGVAGQAAGRRWNRAVRRVTPALMVLNGLLLLALALRSVA